MCVVETKDSSQANDMRKMLEAKYDHLTMTAIGLAHGLDEFGGDDSDGDDSASEDTDAKSERRDTLSPMPSPRTQRKRIDSFSNKLGGGLKMPVVSLRRGSMTVQTLTKTPEWKLPDHVTDGEIEWSTRGTHYPVHSSH